MHHFLGTPGTLRRRRRSLKLQPPRLSTRSSTAGCSLRHCLGAARPEKAKMWVSESSSSQACRAGGRPRWRAGW
jgi:hypothetical protein